MRPIPWDEACAGWGKHHVSWILWGKGANRPGLPDLHSLRVRRCPLDQREVQYHLNPSFSTCCVVLVCLRTNNANVLTTV